MNQMSMRSVPVTKTGASTALADEAATSCAHASRLRASLIPRLTSSTSCNTFGSLPDSTPSASPVVMGQIIDCCRQPGSAGEWGVGKGSHELALAVKP
jgi:hypothetical protein